MAAVCVLGAACFSGMAQAQTRAAAGAAKPPKPAVLKFNSLPAKLSSAGGRVTLTARVQGASTCKITASPAVKGFPLTTPCASGVVGTSVVLPKNKATKAKEQAFVLQALAGTVSSKKATSDVTVDPPFAWSGQLEPPANGTTGDFAGVSCASASFCVAIDGDGNEVTWDGSSWSTGTHVSDTWPNSVSCPSPTFCMIADTTGGVATFDGTNWSAPDEIDSSVNHDLVSVGCGSSQLCAAADVGHDVLGWDGVAWTAPTQLDASTSSSISTSIACAPDSICMAYDSDGWVAEYSSGTWSVPTQPLGSTLSALSCPSSDYCLALSSGGEESTFDGSTWSTPTSSGLSGATFGTLFCQSAISCEVLDGSIWTQQGLGWTDEPELREMYSQTGISCPSATFCVEVDASGNAVVFDPTNPPGVPASQPLNEPQGGDMTSASCVDSTWCLAVDSSGDYLVDTNGTWSAPQPAAPGVQLTAVSCVSTTDCVAVGRAGSALTFDGASWSSPTAIDPAGGLNGVSCVAPGSGDSAQFCVAIDQDGNAMSFDGTSWSAPTSVNGFDQALASVSCANASSCVASGADSDVEIYSGVWSVPSAVPGMPTITDVSCPTASFCMAVGGNQSVTLVAGQWQTPESIASVVAAASVSCSGPSSCTALSNGGAAFQYNGSSWSAGVQTNTLGVGPGPGQLSCPAAGFCAAVGAEWLLMESSGTWDPPGKIDAPSMGLQGMSCPSASPGFCLAVDAGGYAYTESGGSWSGPTRVAAQYLSDVSCADANLCVAVGGNDSFVWDGVSWTEIVVTTDTQIAIAQVSCPTDSFCMAVTGGGGSTYVFDGASWTGPVSAAAGPGTVSCTSSTFCEASSGYGMSTFDGTSWTVSGAPGFDSTPAMVSCTSPGFCMAVGTWSPPGEYPALGYSTWNGTSWTPVSTTHLGLSSTVVGVSCVSPTQCVAGSDSGTLAWNGSAWSEPAGSGGGPISCSTAVDCSQAMGTGVETFDSTGWIYPGEADPHATLTAISCSVDWLCVAVDNTGQAFSSTLTEWSNSGMIDAGGDFTAVGCAPGSTLWCVALDSAGQAFVDAADSWSGPSPTGLGHVEAVSCPSSSFCAAFDDTGRVSTYDGSSWTVPVKPLGLISGGERSSVSCTSATSCVAVDDEGDTATYDDTSWTAGPSVEADSVSCATSTNCVAVEAAGDAVYFDGSSWSTPQPFDVNGGGQSDDPNGVTCASTEFCVAVDGTGQALVYDGTAWSPAVQIAPTQASLGEVSCPTLTFCATLGTDNEVFAGAA